jgi:hypothetical protein
MTAQDAEAGYSDGPYQVIRLGGQDAAIVPLADLRRLQAVERLAPAEVVESAKIETTLAAHREWAAAGGLVRYRMTRRWRRCSAGRDDRMVSDGSGGAAVGLLAVDPFAPRLTSAHSAGRLLAGSPP